MKNKLIRITKNPDLETKKYQKGVEHDVENISQNERVVGTITIGDTTHKLYEKFIEGNMATDSYTFNTGISAEKIISITSSYCRGTNSTLWHPIPATNSKVGTSQSISVGYDVNVTVLIAFAFSATAGYPIKVRAIVRYIK